jgi:hypothetical protein
MTNADSDGTIWIESARDRYAHGNACLVKWQGRERYAPVKDIRTTAEDLFACAAYADVISELLRMGMEGQTVTRFLQGIMRHRQPRHFGRASTFFMLPGGSSARKAGAVAIARRDLFHQGKADGQLSPDEARAMGRQWLAAAEASEADTLFGYVLENSGWMEPVELDALFSLLNDIRGGDAQVPPPRSAQ